MNPFTFSVHLPGVGEFVFRSPTLGEQIRLEQEYYRLVGGGPVAPDNGVMAQTIARINVTAVSTPRGWEAPEQFRRDDHDKRNQLVELWMLITEKEGFFPPAAGTPGTGTGNGDRADHGVLVPENLRATAE